MYAFLLPAPAARAAFEPVPQSPWLAGGAASALFPRCALSLCANPASPGLLEGPSASFAAARPFGLRSLDRAALAASVPRGGMCFQTAVLASGDDSYDEWTFKGGVSARLMSHLVGGLSLSWHRLSIRGFGSAGGFSADAGLVARPLRGVLVGASAGGFVRSGLGDTGDPVVPRTISVSAGVVPLERLSAAAGLSFQEGLDPEAAFTLRYSPSSVLAVGVDILSGPPRFGVSIALGTGPLEFQYGLSEHPDLGSTHSAGIVLGRAAAVHPPVALAEEPSEPPVEMPLDLNEAGVEDLVLVPGIGPARAEAIVAWRLENGPFRSVDQLVEVPGIGPALLESMRPWLVVR